jgi:ATP-dependent DNA ligase
MAQGFQYRALCTATRRSRGQPVGPQDSGLPTISLLSEHILLQKIKEKIQWVKPKLVCEIEYAELTADDRLRQTTFLGWRDDKKPEEVVLE